MLSSTRIALAAIILAAPVAVAHAATQGQDHAIGSPVAQAAPSPSAHPGIGMAQSDMSEGQSAGMPMQAEDEDEGGGATGLGMMGPGMMGGGMMGGGMMGGGMMGGRGMMGQGMGGDMQPMMRMMQGMMQMMQGMMEMMERPAGFPPGRGMMMRGRFVEGHLAALKAELGITDAQMPQWNAFADAVRARAKAMVGQMPMMRRGTAMSWPDRIARHEQWLSARLDGLKAMEGPTKALWDVLSEEQRSRAEAMMPGPMGRR